MTQCHDTKYYYDLEAVKPIAPYFLLSAMIPTLAIYTGTFKAFTMLTIGAPAILHVSGIKPLDQLKHNIDDMYHYNLDAVKCYFGISNYYNPNNYNDLDAARLNHDICLKKGFREATGIEFTTFLIKILGYELWDKSENIEVDIADCKRYAFDTYVLRLEDQPSTVDA